MKILIILSFLLVSITGCQSIPKNIFVEKVKPSPEIMKDCGLYFKPANSSEAEFMTVIIKNKELFESCKALNNEKKKFIEEQQK